MRNDYPFAIPSDQRAFPYAQQRSRYLASPNLKPPPRREPSRPALPPQEFECLVEGKNVRLKEIGEVVQDEAGNFYEVQGEEFRRLDELVVDESGSVFEICSADETNSIEATPEPSNGNAVATHGEHPNRNGKIATTPGPTNGHDMAAQPQAKKQQAEKQIGYQKLFADPGIRLKLPFTRIKRMIASQLRYPEKLNDSDLIECYAQFYEVQHTLPMAHIAAVELGNAAAASQFHLLTPEQAQNLGTPQLFKPTSRPFEAQTSPRQLYPGQRVFRLWPVFDPTLEPEKTSDRRVVAPQEAATALRRAIPEPYMNPVQFKYSREEVLYDMKMAFGTLPPEAGALSRWFFIYPLRLLKVLLTVVASRKRMKKWRAMLMGKSPDHQLWAVTPPAGFAHLPSVRHWTEEMLAQAGYDSGRMLLEWEIFWRRKGWN